MLCFGRRFDPADLVARSRNDSDHKLLSNATKNLQGYYSITIFVSSINIYYIHNYYVEMINDSNMFKYTILFKLILKSPQISESI